MHALTDDVVKLQYAEKGKESRDSGPETLDHREGEPRFGSRNTGSSQESSGTDARLRAAREVDPESQLPR